MKISSETARASLSFTLALEIGVPKLKKIRKKIETDLLRCISDGHQASAAFRAAEMQTIDEFIATMTEAKKGS